EDVNWVTRKHVTSVRNLRSDEQFCFGASSASAVVDVVEALVKSQTKKLRKLSIQELLDCSGSGCRSYGDFDKVYSKYIMEKNGLVCEINYPYVKAQKTCSVKGQRYGKISNIQHTSYGHLTLFKTLLTKGPEYFERSAKQMLSRIHWGTDWGEKGYMRISIDPRENCNLYLDSLALM
ncbi:unnamed protein product, partial [Wuchereria bancrofti]